MVRGVLRRRYRQTVVHSRGKMGDRVGKLGSIREGVVGQSEVCSCHPPVGYDATTDQNREGFRLGSHQNHHREVHLVVAVAFRIVSATSSIHVVLNCHIDHPNCLGVSVSTYLHRQKDQKDHQED